MASALKAVKRRLPIGGELLPGGAHFRVWAPKCNRVALVISNAAGMVDRERVELAAEDHGYFSGTVDGLGAGTPYGFRLDDRERIFPDPASRFQPNGTLGWSQLVDPNTFSWTDRGWPGLTADGQVLYEMHIGTFTPEGTWESAARELSELARAGITALEIMPVAEFPGSFGWGYDGVALFAPTRLYGTPDDFRRFVDRAHAEGLGIILDIVYNHFGNVDNYVREFSDDYRSDCHENEWADAINFDGENSQPVREFFIANARYWIEEFHLDGFRFDATQAIFDNSPTHILADVATAAREAAGDRKLYLIAENEPQQVRTVLPTVQGGHGLDALWNDDFHHSATVRLTGDNPAYYSDFLGSSEEFVAALKYGFVYQGQVSQWQRKPRGTPTFGLPVTAFITFLQNHDQVANTGFGTRIHNMTSPGRLRAMTALWLLAPQTPLLFQGQEFAASSPFLYFADFSGDVSQAVAKGRAAFLSQFPKLSTPQAQSALPTPTDRANFARSKLNFAERESHRTTYDLHKDLLRMRHDDPVFNRQPTDRIEVATLGPDALLVRFFGDESDQRLVIVNFGHACKYSPVAQPLLAPPAESTWELVWSSDDPRYGGRGIAAYQINDAWQIPGEAAIVLEARPIANYLTETKRAPK